MRHGARRRLKGPPWRAENLSNDRRRLGNPPGRVLDLRGWGKTGGLTRDMIRDPVGLLFICIAGLLDGPFGLDAGRAGVACAAEGTSARATPSGQGAEIALGPRPQILSSNRDAAEAMTRDATAPVNSLPLHPH